ncbi:IS5 family transposase [Paenibacillus provencensis]|uniref:IS5 family transposase n=2 Tax=Paenibacillaceae TaxID=186822 RepID=A0A7Z2VSQ1_9BACL|nr:IS5 family transposase [Cohnella herbarum]
MCIQTTKTRNGLVNYSYEKTIRDDQWEQLKDLLPLERKLQRGRPATDNRKMLNGMLWVIRSGVPWRDLPEYYGSWSSVHSRFRRWEKTGIFDRMLEVLSTEPDSESVMIDASIVRAHQYGAGAKGGSNSSDRTISRRLNLQDSRGCGCSGQFPPNGSDGRQYQRLCGGLRDIAVP